jgi:hypothetical protein
MYLADTCPEWSATRDRHILTGHIHHDSIKDFPGVKWWSLRAFCPPDEYGAAFGGRRALQSLTFDDKTGLRMHLIEGIYLECGQTRMGNDPMTEQIGGDHYRNMKIQPLEYSMANGLNACEHSVIKYVARHRAKNGRQDLEKAIDMLHKLIAFEYPE